MTFKGIVSPETGSSSTPGVRYKFGTTEGEKEWLSGFYATPNEALGFFEFLVGIQAVGDSKPLAPTTLIVNHLRCFCRCRFLDDLRYIRYN